MFFSDPYNKFFQPLSGKYREQVVACLKALYAYSFSHNATYTQFLKKNDVLIIFQDTITQTPITYDMEESNDAIKDDRQQALWVFGQLLGNGWLEQRVDEAILESYYAFSRMGRLFSQTCVEAAGASFRTRHRNTRNTRNALSSFLDHGEVYDLLDAYEYSERIVSDFTDVIDELEENKRKMVRDIETSELLKHTTDTFFEFMEKRFIPDISIRLSADSIEKHSSDIKELINQCRKKDDEYKIDKERQLRIIASALIGENEEKQSLYLKLLGSIEDRIYNASKYMLPKLHHTLRSFTQRVDIIIRQLSYIHNGHQSQLLELCQSLKALPEEEQEKRLKKVGESLASFTLKIVDPNNLKISEKQQQRHINTELEKEEVLSELQQKKIYIQKLFDEAFTYQNQNLRDYIEEALMEGHRIRTELLPVKDAQQLIMLAHAIEVGGASQSDNKFQFKIEFTGQTVQHEYFEQMDSYSIEMVRL